MPEIAVNIEVYCASCGDGICNTVESTKTRNRGEPCFRVPACEKCVEAADRAGYERGRDEGYAEGLKDGGDDGD
ncbi:MAG: hypothetical protein AAB922_02325 [Patescibacteria group bacterium]